MPQDRSTEALTKAFIAVDSSIAALDELWERGASDPACIDQSGLVLATRARVQANTVRQQLEIIAGETGCSEVATVANAGLQLVEGGHDVA